MKRSLLGIVALGLVLSGALGLYLGFSANSQEGMAAGVGLRAGLVLGALWMALPQLVQLLEPVPRWLIGTVAIGALIVVVQPKSFMFVAIAVAVLVGLQVTGWFLKPTAKKSKSHGRTSEGRKDAS
jgi:hypothetical protein